MMKTILLLKLIIYCFAEVTITKFSSEDDNYLPDFENTFQSNFKDNPDKYLDTAQIIRRYGYHAESHIVQSPDGYLLTLHRIPVNKNGKAGKQPVFMQHGLLCSSADWVFTGNKSLAFMLSDLGYDVWLGNARGNTYSKAHISLSVDSPQFWNFSFHEMAVNDLPEVLTYVSNVTNKKGDIIYIGHSMGTTVFFAMSSFLPKFAVDTIKVMVGLAPVAYLGHIQSPVRYLAPFADSYEWIAKHLGLKQFLPNNEVMLILSYGCTLLAVDRRICEQVIFAICGFDKEQFDENLLPVILSHDPAGASTKTIVHIGQLVKSKDFKQFDYGETGNFIKYGTRFPPIYNLSNVKVPMHIMYGDNDWLCSEIDLEHLANSIKHNVTLYNIPFKKFNHIDFIWAKDAPKLVYNKLIETIQN